MSDANDEMSAPGLEPETGPVSGFLGQGSGTVKVNDKAYAVGMIWEHVNAEGGKPEAQAREAAKRHSANLFCLRKPSKNQYGLGSRDVGHKPGMAPLASFLAEVLDNSWVGVFETEQGWYFVAVRDDQVLAGCDRLIADRQEASDAFAELFYASTWDQSFAPKDWGIEGTTPASLEDVIGAAKAQAILVQASNRDILVKILGGILLLGVGIVGWQQYQAYLEEQAEQERLAAIAAQTEADKANQAKVPPPPPPPWEGKGKAVDALTACVDAIMAAPIDVPGWKTEALTCEGNSVVMTLARQGGTINWIPAHLNREGFKPSIQPVNDSNVGVSWSFPAVGTQPKDVTTASLRDVRRYLVSQFEETYHKVDVTQGESTLYYMGLSFSFRTKHDPKEFSRILAPIPAMVITKVKLELASWTWTIEGNVYEKLSPPPAGKPGAPGAVPAARPAQ